MTFRHCYLERGCLLRSNEEGSVLRSVTEVQPDDLVEVQLLDGALSCRVEGEVASGLSALLSLEDSHE